MRSATGPEVHSLAMDVVLGVNGLPIIEAVRKHLNGRRIILVDGIGGVGKSPIARDLAAALGGAHIELDCFLERDQNKYLGALDLNKIGGAMQTALVGERTAVVDGWVALKVAEAIQLRPSEFLHVYVVRWNPTRNCPEDDDLFDDRVGEEEPVASVTHPARESAKDELARYTRVVKPHSQAEILVRRPPGALPPEALD